MKTQPFKPVYALAKHVEVSAVSQSVDLVGELDLSDDCRQVRVVNDSTGKVSVIFGSILVPLTASFSEGGGAHHLAGTSEVITRPDGCTRCAVIGAAANGTVQLIPGTGY